MSGRRKAALWLSLAVLLAAGFSPLGLKLLREYRWRSDHNARWFAMRSYFFGYAYLGQEKPQDSIHGERRAAYKAVYDAITAELRARDELLLSSASGQQLVAAALKAIESRDSEALSLLGPQIVKEKHDLAQARKDWLASAAKVNEAVSALKTSWDAFWPENGLSFELTESSRPAPGKDKAAQAEQLLEAAWRDSQELRLARLHSGGAAGDFPVAAPGLSPHQQGLLDAYADSLALRAELRSAFEANVSALEQDAGVDLSSVELADVKPPGKAYLANKVNASIARLRLLSILSGMLDNSSESYGRETNRIWLFNWPDHPLPEGPDLLPQE